MTSATAIKTANSAATHVAASAQSIKVWFWTLDIHHLEFWISICNCALIIGALLVFVGTAGSIKLTGSKEILTDIRISTNETLAATARSDASQAQQGLEQAKLKIAEAELRAGKLSKDAAEAKLESERLKHAVAWREPTSAQLTAFTRALSDEPMALSFQTIMQEPESINLSTILINAACRAGVQITPGGLALGVERVPTDVLVVGSQSNKTRLEDAFKLAGLTVTVGADSKNTTVFIMPKPQPLKP